MNKIGSNTINGSQPRFKANLGLAFLIYGWRDEELLTFDVKLKNAKSIVMIDIPKEDQIELNKDKTNLSVEVGFVGANYDRYLNAWETFIRSNPDTIEVANWAEEIGFGEEVNFCDSELTPTECRQILSRMPVVLRQLSKLEAVQSYAVVPV